MTSKSKITKFVAAAALTISLAPPLASTNTTLAMEPEKPGTQEQKQPVKQETDNQDSLMLKLLEITKDQNTIVERILKYLGINIGQNTDNTEKSQQHKQEAKP